MDIKIPSGFDHIKDEGILTLLGFAQRVCERYGFDDWYTLSKEDCAVICNKNGVGLVKWLLRHDLEGFEVGDPYSHTMMFKLRNPNLLRRNQKQIDWFTPTDERTKLVWMYIIGCVNHNLLTDEIATTNDDSRYIRRRHANCRNIEEFKITREALHYVKQTDKELE